MKTYKWLRNLNKTQVVSYILFVLSGIILSGTLLLNLNVDVLKDWRLVLPNQAIHAGDTIVVQSLYTKTMNVTGKSTRYVECTTDGNGIYIRYPISEAVANRATGTSGTGIVMLMPKTIPNLPTTCRINVTIEYDIMLFRKVVESANSDTFTLLPVVSSDGESAKQETSQTQLPDSGKVGLNQSSSSYQNTPVSTFNQRDTSQQDDIPTNQEKQLSGQPEPQPTVLDKLTQPITNLLGGL